MSKYRAFIKSENEYIYTDYVEIDAPCGEPYYAAMLIDGYKGIPIFKQVYTREVEKLENGEFRFLTDNEITNIKEMLENRRYVVLD